MMRPMKLAGQELLFGEGTLAHLADIKSKKMVIVLGDDIVYKNGVMEKIAFRRRTDLFDASPCVC